MEIGKGKGKEWQSVDSIVTSFARELSPADPSMTDRPIATSSRKQPSFGYDGNTDDFTQVVDRLWELIHEKDKQIKEVSEKVLERAEELKAVLRDVHDIRQKKKRDVQDLRRKKKQQMAALKVQHTEELAAMEAWYQQALAKECKQYQTLWQQHQEASRELQQHKERPACIAHLMGSLPPQTGAS